MTYDVAVIGAGPGGYVCALRCAQYGLKVAVVEKDLVGGTCLNRGCIPTKTLLFASGLIRDMGKGNLYGVAAEGVHADYPALRARCESVVGQLRGGVEKLFKQRKIDLIRGEGRVTAKGRVTVKTAEGDVEIDAKNIVLATGSAPAVPPIPGADLPGVYTSDSLLAELPELKRLVIIGGGVIGVEFAEAYSGFGADVTVVEMLPRMLMPFDQDLARHLAADFKKKGVKVICKAAVTGIVSKDGALAVQYKLGEEEKEIPADGVLIATGRKPLLEGLVPFELKTERRLLVVDEKCRTSEEGVYAIGDIVYGYPQLAHTAESMGKIAAAAIAGKDEDLDLSLIPQCVYTAPDIASVGLTEEEAKEKGEVRTSRVMMGTNARSLICGEGGYIKFVCDGDGHILGAQLMCRDADNLIGEISLAIRHKLTAEDFAATVRPHPSVEEALEEAAEGIVGLAIHGR